MNTRTLTAAATRTLTAAAMAVEDVDVDARLVSGLVLPFGEWGNTSVGPALVAGPGVVALPPRDQWSRVKLTDEHIDPPVSIGYAVDLRERPEGIRAQFRISPTRRGDEVLEEMTADEHGGRARDGFSVVLRDLDITDSGEVRSAMLHLVGAVVAPAWANAREDGLAASESTTEGSTMLTEEERARLTELLAIAPDDRSPEEQEELDALLAKAGRTEAEASEEETPESGASLEAGHSAPTPRPRRPARVPVRTNARRTEARPIRELFAAQARVFSGQSRPELEAALADITSTAHLWTAEDEYAGQLWGGVEYTRQYVPLMLGGDLNSYKGSGWKWTTKPEVGDYAGDKAAVPSNTPVTVATTWQAARLAGAHDIDRKYFDFGDTEFIEAYYAAMRESYAIKSDAKARAFILANATAAGAAGTSIYHAAAKASQAVFDATGGRTPDYLLVNSGDTFGLLDTPADQQPDPKVLEMFGVTSDKFKVTPGVAAGTVVAGIREATKFRELGGSPIRVEAINIANGGVDGGVFGYYATEETFDGGIQSATFVAA